VRLQARPLVLTADQWLARREAGRQHLAQLRRNATTARRARQQDAPQEPVTITYLYERDHGRCGLCGKRINSKLSHPHPFSCVVGSHHRRGTGWQRSSQQPPRCTQALQPPQAHTSSRRATPALRISMLSYAVLLHSQQPSPSKPLLDKSEKYRRAPQITCAWSSPFLYGFVPSWGP
jgi:hypothetical protein